MKWLFPSKKNYWTGDSSCQWFFLPFYFFTFLILSSCSTDPNLFKLEGHFKNLNEGEFYIYDINDGWKDTIAVQGGDFNYQRAMKDATTLILLFPNYSELPILARGGGKVSIKGDVSHLRETEVSGNEENEELTNFRIQVNDLSPEQAVAEARKFIKAHPASPACQYILRRFFLLSATPDYAEASDLCATIVKAQPTNRQMLRLRNILKDIKEKNLTEMPLFSAVDTDGDTITNEYLHSTINIVQAWANWNYDSQNVIGLINRKKKEYPDSIAAIAISLDATPAEGASIWKRDSITWPNICDGEMWQSPLVKLFGITSVTENIIFDRQGKVVARHLTIPELEKRIDDLLK